MKLLSRSAWLSLAVFALTACNKKVESPEVTPESNTSPETATAPAGAPDAAGPDSVAATDPKAAPAAGNAGDDVLLANLSPEDRERFEAWFKKHNLSLNATVMDQDADGDGYSNREEFLNGTNPRDPNSLPGVMEGVTLKEVNEVQVPLILREVKNGKARVESTKDGTLADIAQGDQPRGLPYKVTGVKHEIKADKHGVLNDVSNVTLENPATKETVVLIRDLPARSSQTHAVLAGPGGAEQKVRVDDVISLPGQGAKKFKVVDLRPDQVVVEEIGSKKPMTIPKR
jgi:hypothetical protein